MNTKLEYLISEILHIPEDKVTDDLTMSEVETWDLLEHMNMVASLEQSFGVEYTFDEIVHMQSVGEIKRVLRSKGVEI